MTENPEPKRDVPRRAVPLVAWMLNLFDPPPLVSLNFKQKLGRVFLLSSTLVVGSVLVAMLGALALYLMERGRELGSTPEFLNGLGILAIGIAVNAACVVVILNIRKADTYLVPPEKEKI